jgi:acetyltransferase
MSVRDLEHLFHPTSVAVIGASERQHSVGGAVMRNLLQGSFAGPIMPVNPRRQAVAGVLAYKDVDSLPVVPDLAVLCIPAASVLPAIGRLIARGTRAAVVLAAGKTLSADLSEAVRGSQMRVLGPNCLGLMVPAAGLNASAGPLAALPGRVAFVSQSGALCSAVLDWARPKGIGFSHFLSLGEAADIGFGDILDYLGSDSSTRAILLYIESIRQRRNFLSAARAAARNKPILAIKAGRAAEGARAAASHTGTLTGTDAVYDAALRRAGMLRVFDLDEMFTAVETLSHPRPTRGTSLTVVTNGGAIGVMAVDDLSALGGQLTVLSPDSIDKLNRILPSEWSRGNPIDIADNANGERYAKTLDVLFAAPEVDAVLVMHAPTSLSSSTDIAEQVIKTVKAKRANVMACWVGQAQVANARRLLHEAGIATYETPGAAVRAFMHLVDYRKNQIILMETPASVLDTFVPDTVLARRLVQTALEVGDGVVPEHQAKALLTAYGIPSVETHFAATAAEAGRLADQLDGPVALKIVSRDIAHKSAAGGVALNLHGAAEVIKAAERMQSTVADRFPAARLDGFVVERMADHAGAHEIIIGVTTDPVFGPVIMFGQGGTAVEVIRDAAVALPPLNTSLANDMIQRTRVWQLLKGYEGTPPADIGAVCLALMKVSQLIIDFPEVVELDINPLFVGPQGVLAVDARLRVRPAPALAEHLAIRPYPRELEETMVLNDGRKVFVRPIRPEDEPSHHVFVSKMSPEDIRFRFFGLVGELAHSEMARFTQIDYDREMAFIAICGEGADRRTVGVVRTVCDADNETAEFAVVVLSDFKGTGLARKLMMKMIVYCLARGTGQIVGQVLTDNIRMLKFIEAMGFKRLRRVEDNIVEVALDLRAPGRALG